VSPIGLSGIIVQHMHTFAGTAVVTEVVEQLNIYFQCPSCVFQRTGVGIARIYPFYRHVENKKRKYFH
jgi:hypothetical protein